MALERELSKQRSARFAVTNPKRPNKLQRWKTFLVALAALVSVAWLASAFALPDAGVQRYSRGPLTEVHAQWDQQCDVCHRAPLTPVNNNTFLPEQLFGQRFTRTDLASSCLHCHGGPPHVARQKDNDPADVTCGACHRDHQGRDYTLVRTADRDCIRCHDALTDHTVDGQSVYKDVVDFPSHPEFRPEIGPIRKAEDRTLKFSHKQHMTAGMGLSSDSARPWKLENILQLARKSSTDPTLDPDLEPYFRGQMERYRQPGQKDSDAVVLDCKSCHVLDGTNTGITRDMLTEQSIDTINLARQPGAYYLPINYDAHCKGCHPTQVQVAANMPKIITPHRLQPQPMNNYLWDAYVRLTLADKPQTRQALLQRSRLDPVTDDAEQIAEANKEVQATVKKAENWIYDSDGWKRDVSESERLTYLGTGNCGKCHDYIPASTPDPERPFVPGAIKATNIPTVWQQHAKFSHVAHRAMDCRGCHAPYYADGVGDNSAKVDAAPLMEKEPVDFEKGWIAGSIQNCKSCHGPARVEQGKRVAGSRHDCVLCHSYHHRDNPLAGLGDTARDPSTKWDLKQLLYGDLKKTPD
jgi:predicted CXXCH cytochrome family protein